MSVQVSYKKQVLVGIFLLLLVLIIFEGILRIYDHYNPNCKMTSSDVFSDTDDELKRSICLDNDNLRWSDFPYLHLEPNQHYTTIDINTHGFRGDEITVDKPFDTFRIFVIGGSTTFGVGSTSNSNTIPGYLQNYFNSVPELNVEVINAGIPKAFSYSEINYVQKSLLKYEPDLLIVYDGFNDLGRSSDKYYEETGDTSLLSKIMRMLFKNPYYETPGILLKNYQNWRINTVDSVKSQNFEDIDQRVKLWQKSWSEICELGNKENFDVVITLQPLLGTGLKQLTNEEKKNYSLYNQNEKLSNYKKFGPALNELNSTCTATKDLRNSFDNYSETIFFDGGHVGDLGNQIIAEKLFEISLPIIEKNS